MIKRILSRWPLLLCLLMMSGCLGRKSPDVTYFSLLSMEQLGDIQVISSHPQVNLGVGPITIPDSLKRSQVVTRRYGNQFAFDEFNRWAGVLEKDMTNVVGDNLGGLLGVEKVGFFPWMSYFSPTYRVVIDIQRLDGALDGEAVLNARWAVADAGGKELLAGGKINLSEPVQEPGYPALIRAESLLVAGMSKQIAVEINRLLTMK